jgi:hypothetical protein
MPKEIKETTRRQRQTNTSISSSSTSRNSRRRISTIDLTIDDHDPPPAISQHSISHTINQHPHEQESISDEALAQLLQNDEYSLQNDRQRNHEEMTSVAERRGLLTNPLNYVQNMDESYEVYTTSFYPGIVGTRRSNRKCKKQLVPGICYILSTYPAVE